MWDVKRCPMIFIKKFVDSRAAMLEGVAGLKKMVLAFGVGDGILGNVVHRKVYMFDLFGEGEHIIVRSIKIRDGILRIKVGKKGDSIMKVGGRFEINKQFVRSRIEIIS